MKCTNCKALLVMKRRIVNNRLQGLVKIYHCNICDKDLKTFKPSSGEVPEYFVPLEHKVTFCGDCLRLAAVHFEIVNFVLRSGHVVQSVITQCEECYRKTEQERQPKPIPKVKRPRQIKYICGDVIGWNFAG